MSEENIMIGDFPVPLDSIVVSTLPVGVDVTFEIKKSERKEYDEKVDGQPTGRKLPYYSLQLGLPDFPGETVFHKYFLRAQNLSNRHADRSWKVFLDTLQLPYIRSDGSPQTAADNALANIRFIGQLREDKNRGEYVISKIVSAA